MLSNWRLASLAEDRAVAQAIIDYVASFIEEWGRKPTPDELLRVLKSRDPAA